MRELSLFSGAGGGLLGTKLLGFTHCGYVEYDDYCQRVIAQRIKDGFLDEAPIFGDIRTFISEGYADSYKGMVDVVTAGFPCQPFSVAGKQQAEKDERNMWPQTRDVISRVRPRFALLENVPGLFNHQYIQQIFGSLAEVGYDSKWVPLSASEVGGIHVRERAWIFSEDHRNKYVKSADYSGKRRERGCAKQVQGESVLPWGEGIRGVEDLRNRSDIPESIIWRMDDGVADRLDRTKAIGNGQVPAVVATAWNLLKGDL